MAKKQLNVEEKVTAEDAVTKEIAEDVAAEFVEQKQSLKEQYPDGVPLYILNSLA
jgi:hypothetical protein